MRDRLTPCAPSGSHSCASGAAWAQHLTPSGAHVLAWLTHTPVLCPLQQQLLQGLQRRAGVSLHSSGETAVEATWELTQAAPDQVGGSPLALGHRGSPSHSLPLLTPPSPPSSPQVAGTVVLGLVNLIGVAILAAQMGNPSSRAVLIHHGLGWIASCLPAFVVGGGVGWTHRHAGAAARARRGARG